MYVYIPNKSIGRTLFCLQKMIIYMYKPKYMYLIWFELNILILYKIQLGMGTSSKTFTTRQYFYTLIKECTPNLETSRIFLCSSSKKIMSLKSIPLSVFILKIKKHLNNFLKQKIDQIKLAIICKCTSSSYYQYKF